jgi:hypothetical protein
MGEWVELGIASADDPFFHFVHMTCGAMGWVEDNSFVKMATGTRNPSTRQVLPDKEVGMWWIFYPWVRYWVKSYTHRVWRVQVQVYTTHTCQPTGKKYPQKELVTLIILVHTTHEFGPNPTKPLYYIYCNDVIILMLVCNLLKAWNDLFLYVNVWYLHVILVYDVGCGLPIG